MSREFPRKSGNLFLRSGSRILQLLVDGNIREEAGGLYVCLNPQQLWVYSKQCLGNYPKIPIIKCMER